MAPKVDDRANGLPPKSAGQTHIATAPAAAEALRPLAGAGAYWLFTLG
jgi:hypothetical protein